MGEQRITIGKFGRPHGREGKVRLWLYNDDTELVYPGSTVAIEREDGLEEVTFTSVQERDRFVIVGLEGYDYRDRAEELTHLEISVDRDELPPPEEGEYYSSDLIGFDVEMPVDGELTRIGELQGFLDNVDTDVMVITGPRIKNRWLVAFIAETVAEVDVEGERLVLHPPEQWAHEDQELLPE